MQLVHSLAFGIFILILVYLGLKDPKAVVSIFNSGGNQINTGINTLQGR